MTSYVCKHYSKFDKDCKDLFSKCTTLEEDLKRFKTSLIDDLISNNGVVPTNNKIFFHVNRLKAELPVFKVKRFRCKGINKGSNSGFRLVFAYDRSLSLIYFIEFYYKRSKKTEMNKKRAIEACNEIIQ